MIDVLVRLIVVAGNDGDVAAIDDPEEGQEIDVVFEHIREILRRGLANAGSALRGAGTHHLALVPGDADEANLGAHGADGVAVRRAIGRAHEGGDALRLEGAVMQLRRIDVIVGALVLMGSLMLMRHVLPGHGLAPGVVSLGPSPVSVGGTPAAGGTSPIDTSCISRPVSTFGVGRPQSGQRKL